MNCLKVFFIVVGVFLLLFSGTQISYSASQKGATSPVEEIIKASPLASQQPSSQKKKKQKTKPSPITKPLNLQPVKGYCCAQGTFYSRITRAECQRKKGHYSSNKESIKSNCGWCCKDGKVRSVSSAEEKKKRCATGAKLHKTEGLADRNCGWCCKTKGIVVASLRSECDVKKFHQEKSEAEKQCKPPSGYCNVRGKTLKRISPERCKRLGGTFYKRFALANRDLLTFIRQEALNETRDTRDANQQEPLIWCCDDGKVSRITKEECVGTKNKPLNGKIFKTQKEALNACRNLGLMRAQRFEKFNPTGVKPALLPDLEIVKTSTNKQCFMTVRVKNNGGPISSSNHGASTIHLSAGPGNISGKTQLTDIDPGGVLKSAGGEITAITDVRITQASQATLTWVDTNHQIVESNETNNGDDAVLSCKTPLIWCCRKKQPGMIGGANQVGQMTQEECKKANGTTHMSEAKANKACGIKVSAIKTAKFMAPPITVPSKDSEEKTERRIGVKPAASGMDRLISKRPSTVYRSTLASSLPMEIMIPMENQAYQRGDTMQVRYKINTPTEAGTVTFRLFSSTGEELATTTHGYSPPDISSVDLSEAELEPVGGGLLGSLDDEPSDRPMGTGERQFSWPLPAELETPLGTTLYITGQKEGLRGRSGNFHVQPEYFGEIRVSTPNGGEHWEACGSPAIRWHYFDDPATMPAEWDVELVRGAARQYLVRSRCSEYVDHSDSYPPYRECIERTVRPCMETGTYHVRVTGGGLTDRSDATFRIGITPEWPMISLSAPGGGRVYSRGGPMPIGFYSTSEFDAEIKIIKGGVLIKDSFNRDGVTTHHETYVIPEHFPDGDNYTVQVSDRDNPLNSVESTPFTISGGTVDFSIMDIGSTDGRNLYADVRIVSPESGTPFSRRVQFTVWRPYRSWTVIRDLSGPGGRVNLGALNLPDDMTGHPCGVDYTVTVDEPNVYMELDETNNAMSKEVAFTGDRGYVTLYQTPGRTHDVRTFRCGKEPDAFNGNRHGFFIRIKNCGIDTARGRVEVRQVGSWPNEPHGFSISRDISIYSDFVSVGPNETETIEIWNDGSRCWDSTLEFHFEGDFAPWVSVNPIRVDLDVSYISR